MDLHRRKLWGDRVTLLLVAGATLTLWYRWATRGGRANLYLFAGWLGVVAVLLFFGEFRIGRRKPPKDDDSWHRGWAAWVGAEHTDIAGTRAREWTGTAAGLLDLSPDGVEWTPRSEQSGREALSLAWTDLWSWRMSSVFPLLRRASGYLTLITTAGREITFHVHGLKRWRTALRDGFIVGPVREPGPEPEVKPEPPPEPDVKEEPAVPEPEAEKKAEPEPEPEPEPESTPEEEPVTQTATATQPKADEWEAVIGLECHVELSTASKVFCGCPTKFGSDPNTQICPVCTGQPGSLPVLNEKAFEYAVRIGVALNCAIARESIFHRKNYFYPDMPKNYQISQYDRPLATKGYLEVEVEGERRRIGVHRVHLEEDTGKTTHAGTTGRIAEATYAKVDFNRAGVPLVEIVSEPDVRTPEEARAYLTELRSLLQAIGVSDVRMEEGSLRCDANISVRPVGENELGVKTEVKNMNSIRSVERALAYEIERQTKRAKEGEPILQETRHFDENSGSTSSLRTKEYAFDYRYFPDPDLVPVAPDAVWLESIRSSLPELPAERRQRLIREWALEPVDARTLTSSPGLADAVEEAARIYGGDPKAIARWYLNDIAALAGERETQDVISPAHVAELQKLVDGQKISISVAKGKVLNIVAETGKAPEAVVQEEGLGLIADTSALESVVDEVIAANPEFVKQIAEGKDGLRNALVGQVMKQTRGQADAKTVQQLLNEKLPKP